MIRQLPLLALLLSLGLGQTVTHQEMTLDSQTLQRYVGLTNGYGLGFAVARREGYVAFEHDGAVAGYTAELIINRGKGISVIVLSNGAANPGSLGERALDMLSK